MSIWAVNWALHTRVESALHKLVLISLANFANDEDEAWPKVETLAGLASTSTRSVQRALAWLESAGLIERRTGFAVGGRGGLRRANSVYRLLLPETVSRASSAGGSRPQVIRAAATPLSETPSQHRCDTDDVTIPAVGETPSQDRCDTGVVTINRCDSGVANRCDTGVTSIENHQVEPPNLTPLPPTAGGDAVPPGRVGSGRVADEGATEVVGLTAATSTTSPPDLEPPVEDPPRASSMPARDPERVRADWDLCRRVLPEPMQALDDPGVAHVAGLLRERLEAGWPPATLREALAANPLPAQVRHLAALVAHRLGQLPPAAAPSSPPSRRQAALPPSLPPLADHERDPRAVRAERARAEAIRSGSPEAGRSRWSFVKQILDAEIAGESSTA